MTTVFLLIVLAFPDLGIGGALTQCKWCLGASMMGASEDHFESKVKGKSLYDTIPQLPALELSV